jgi:hypothetical protein
MSALSRKPTALNTIAIDIRAQIIPPFRQDVCMNFTQTVDTAMADIAAAK